MQHDTHVKIAYVVDQVSSGTIPWSQCHATAPTLCPLRKYLLVRRRCCDREKLVPLPQQVHCPNRLGPARLHHATVDTITVDTHDTTRTAESDNAAGTAVKCRPLCATPSLNQSEQTKHPKRIHTGCTEAQQCEQQDQQHSTHPRSWMPVAGDSTKNQAPQL